VAVVGAPLLSALVPTNDIMNNDIQSDGELYGLQQLMEPLDPPLRDTDPPTTLENQPEALSAAISITSLS
jgi:hypothetical protein